MYTRSQRKPRTRLNPSVSINGAPTHAPLRPGVQPLDAPGTPARSHSFRDVAVKPTSEPKRAQDDSAAPLAPAPLTPAPLTPDAVPMDAGSAAKAKPSLATSNDTYDDSATESHKRIHFDVTIPTGLTAKDYALVNFIKGSMKNG